MPKKKLHISFTSQQYAEEALTLLGKSNSEWYSRIETAQISPTYSEDLPELEGFEDATSEWNHDPDTSMTGGGTMSDPYLFHRRTAYTPSSFTGPQDAHSGSYYVHIEASSTGSPNKYFALERDIPAATGVSKLRFYYHMYGAGMDNGDKAFLSVEVSTDNGNNWTQLQIIEDFGGPSQNPVDKLEGQKQTTPAPSNLPNYQKYSTDSFLQAEVDLSAYGNDSFKIRFLAKSADSPAAGSSPEAWKSDISIDEITFHRNPPETKYLISVTSKEYDILFNDFVSNAKSGYATAKQLFIAREYKIDDEEKAINGWTSVRSENETKMSLRKATKEYMESGHQDTAKRQQYIDLGGTKLPLE